jgi:hypothetical protein
VIPFRLKRATSIVVFWRGGQLVFQNYRTRVSVGADNNSPRAYRTVLLDAGHVCQTFCLVSTWLGLAPFCTMALRDTLIEKDLGLDGIAESVLYIAGVGLQCPTDTVKARSRLSASL